MAAAPGPAAAQRLAGITEAGRDLKVAVIVLGSWPHGTTCHITASSLITSAPHRTRTWPGPRSTTWQPRT